MAMDTSDKRSRPPYVGRPLDGGGSRDADLRSFYPFRLAFFLCSSISTLLNSEPSDNIMAANLRQAEEQLDALEGKSLSDIEGQIPRSKTEGIAEDTLRA